MPDGPFQEEAKGEKRMICPDCKINMEVATDVRLTATVWFCHLCEYFFQRLPNGRLALVPIPPVRQSA